MQRHLRHLPSGRESGRSTCCHPPQRCGSECTRDLLSIRAWCGSLCVCVCVHTLRSVYATSAHTYARIFDWCESHLSLFSVSTLLPLPFSCCRNSVAKFRRSPGGALTAVVKCYRWNLVQSFFYRHTHEAPPALLAASASEHGKL